MCNEAMRLRASVSRGTLLVAGGGLLSFFGFGGQVIG